jgi:hypothetical protein
MEGTLLLERTFKKKSHGLEYECTEHLLNCASERRLGRNNKTKL